MDAAKSSLLLEPESFDQADLMPMQLIQVTSRGVYNQAHIEGALLVEPQELVCGIQPATGKLATAAQLTQLLNRISYDPSVTYVAYDDEGGGWAGRFLWTLDMLGHHTWGYLNGGLHAWVHAGRPLADSTFSAGPVTAKAVEFRINDAPRARLEEVLSAIDDPDQVIWDARSREEYLGYRSGSQRAGHIPGAVNVDWLLLQDPSRQYRLAEGLGETLETLGISADKRVITHCQTHHRSALAYMVGRLLGLDIRAYDGSWSEWGNHPDTPVSR